MTTNPMQRECPEYSPSYYAVFFEAPSGNCLEVCHRSEPSG
jgi:hypothetical protein